MIKTFAGFPNNVVAVACSGQVTRSDYETVLEPSVENALKQPGKIRLYYQIGADFEGIGPAAIWEDFKVGMEHRLRWERIAVVTDIDWISATINVFSFLIAGEVRIFPTSEMLKAREWIVAA